MLVFVCYFLFKVVEPVYSFDVDLCCNLINLHFHLLVSCAF